MLVRIARRAKCSRCLVSMQPFAMHERGLWPEPYRLCVVCVNSGPISYLQRFPEPWFSRYWDTAQKALKCS